MPDKESAVEVTVSSKAVVSKAANVGSLSVTMVTRRSPSGRGGVWRIVTMLMDQVVQARSAWQVKSVSAFRQGSRIERIGGPVRRDRQSPIGMAIAQQHGRCHICALPRILVGYPVVAQTARIT